MCVCNIHPFVISIVLCVKFQKKIGKITVNFLLLLLSNTHCIFIVEKIYNFFLFLFSSSSSSSYRMNVDLILGIHLNIIFCYTVRWLIMMMMMMVVVAMDSLHTLKKQKKTLESSWRKKKKLKEKKLKKKKLSNHICVCGASFFSSIQFSSGFFSSIQME